MTFDTSWNAETKKPKALLDHTTALSLFMFRHPTPRPLFDFFLFGACGGQKRAWGSLELELYRVMSHCVGARNPTRLSAGISALKY